MIRCTGNTRADSFTGITVATSSCRCTCFVRLLVSYLRPSNIDSAKHSWAILALFVKRLRHVWTQVRIVFRGDPGFCRWKLLRRCDRHGLDYVVGLAKNERGTDCDFE